MIAYILLTDVFGILSSFFSKYLDVIKLVPDYISELFTGLKALLYLWLLHVLAAISDSHWHLDWLESGLQKRDTYQCFQCYSGAALTPYAINCSRLSKPLPSF